MKKFLTLILAVCAVSLSSCKKDDPVPTSLNGTTWEGSSSLTGKPADMATYTYTFGDRVFDYVIVGTLDGVTFVSNGSGSYTYEASKIEIKADDGSVIRGTAQGSTSILLNSGDMIRMTIYKK